MSDEIPEAELDRPKKPSLAFSWATLGFILGALFIIALPPRRKDAAPPPPPPPEPAVEKKLPPVRLSTIEAVFEVWQQYASWSNDSTEVALYDDDTKGYTDCYQVVRSSDGVYFFRTIPQLTRPVLEHGVPDNAPLRFTETEEQRAQWLRALHEVNQNQNP